MDLPEIRDRLIWARKRLGLNQTEVEERTGINRKTIGAQEEGRNTTRGLATKYMKKYARVYGVSELWLLTGAGSPFTTRPAEGVRVTVRGALQAGVWTEGFDWAGGDQYDVWVNVSSELEREVLYAAEVRGPSMNRIYPNGSIVILRRRIEGPTDLVSGKRYHVERTQPNGLVESTLKTLVRRHDGTLWLQPESDDPEFSAAIPVRAEMGETISFVGRVVQSIINE